MARSCPWSDANPDLRHRIQMPSPSRVEIEKLIVKQSNTRELEVHSNRDSSEAPARPPMNPASDSG